MRSVMGVRGCFMFIGTACRGLRSRCLRAAALLLGIAIAPAQLDLLAADYYVAPTGGSDANAGSLIAPFGTISHAITVAGAGDTIYLRGGTYNLSSTLSINSSKSGT